MTIQELNIGGIDPNCLHPKPRPTTPRDFFESILFQYQKGNWLVISEISEKKQWQKWKCGGMTFYWPPTDLMGQNMYFLNNKKTAQKQFSEGQ